MKNLIYCKAVGFKNNFTFIRFLYVKKNFRIYLSRLCNSDVECRRYFKFGIRVLQMSFHELK